MIAFATLHTMKHFSHLNSAVEIITKYKGEGPFHLYIKEFFRQNKKYGSKDRKQITQLCYSYFRTGRIFKNKSLADAITAAAFLCADKPNEFLAAFNPVFNDKTSDNIEVKCALLNIHVDSLAIFPFTDELSNGIDAYNFNLSHLVQPNLFLRIRPGYEQTVIDKLKKAGIDFSLINKNCISFVPAIKIDEVLEINKEVVVQDYSSQQTAALMQTATGINTESKIWDCCAASGGKSILAKDTLGDIDLTVSDVRPAILSNLKKRFAAAGIKKYNLQTADLTKPQKNITGSFQMIIADAPCTGSGTWGRTPEQLSFFNKAEIDSYSNLQKKIVSAVTPSLQNGGYLLYITCSVFKKENEDIVKFIETNLSLSLIKEEVLKGYSIKADSMFAALFRKNN